MLIEEVDKNRHNLENIKGLLAMAVGFPTPEKLNQLINGFYTLDGHILFVAIDSGKTVGVIGIDYANRPLGIITHIVVREDKRKQNVGSYLIDHAVEKLELGTIELETDQDAVDFYRACGFKITEIENSYPGIRRFNCLKDIGESK
ncbi:GNAT family N-acetyltransferase [Chloroflexota bacterium]